ncbi:ovarian-specific serine/threonine-protein kinase lok [Anaeramoeba flamelloides]|uniref:Ovarian-specific serine/threonine-protein kinase lok n=1 Tax=Anaeramoeba flamelloides TaxID=1746091 RepID=A0ABQ8Y753_9EUKA|nr:ovarian-specific serine/threonine-protein kinase lok [Anaeramoeba flamelloides]
MYTLSFCTNTTFKILFPKNKVLKYQKPQPIKANKKTDQDHFFKLYDFGELSLKYIKKLGKGTFSIVYLVEKNEKKYAIKITNRLSSSRSINKEIFILKTLQDIPNIIKLHWAYKSPFNPTIMAFEYFESSNFQQVCKANDKQRPVIIRKLFQTMSKVHQLRILHLDLKTDNLLIKLREDDSDVRIIDWGTAMIINNQKYSQRRTTISYRAPEVFDCENENVNYNEKNDIWSIGIILLEIIINHYFIFSSKEYSGKNIYLREEQLKLLKNEIELIKSYMINEYTLKNNENFSQSEISYISIMGENNGYEKLKRIPDIEKDFLFKILEIDPNLRFNSEKALEHEYINSSFIENQN